MLQLRINGSSWGESIGDRWIPLTKDQYSGKRFTYPYLETDSLG